ncbi:acetyl-CoA/propionyl-CoA carboxylase, biotin carboxylase, biotin carboxyl carrier protein (plasmid) [Ketogulonicigenium robustum]|uniref:Acetyl-CoA/propionyl-CoA carboxylase, biotin carboxylase, biotin carboxyl carrier protein n=1 Tax=Ketogulonicigenium robustum TaxID=92947 RepID=A0A1W6P3E4_9RHOB|nr:biotin carboxylase N-terminal domain-containing protein [Ketogulonicigenium robustum]ARO15996.1 acetyl-CoA/propionyl-CoA carboxylase, biotin carboxylase, biotin carboxyl carrier protein [Ketogulonicigenium robustum]
MKNVLIANRGEIALRIVRACHDTGLNAIAVYADPDADALFVRHADAAYALPGTTPAQTYLNIPALLAIAKRAGADAVHPGYGFLSENADFARAVEAAGMVWIGPPPAAITQLGDKIAARQIATSVGAPLVPGTDGPVATGDDIRAFVRDHGLPIAIKAAAGGGGRGMRIVRDASEIDDMFAAATSEATTAFGNGACYVERFLDRPRHVEAQVIADTHGNVVVVGLRDCSLQRRNQKLIEEAPAPFLPPAIETRIATAARDICKAAGYRGAGTVEFLLGADGLVSFLEVNTRLQVEHPVTEETTGLDLVAEQFRIAQGLPLSITDTPAPTGHAIEFRINAEDPGRGFLPTPGPITRFDTPAGPGIRLDSGVAAGDSVAGAFDSLMAKLIVTGPTRDIALARARRALAEFHIEGVASVLPFARAVLNAPDFNGSAPFAVHTRWIETDFADDLASALRVTPADKAVVRGRIEIDGQQHDIAIGPDLLSRIAAKIGTSPAPATTAAPAEQPAPPANTITAPMAGTLARWIVADGTAVAAGTPVAIIEAMKMEVEITAPTAGRLHQQAAQGQPLAQGQPIGTLQ